MCIYVHVCIACKYIYIYIYSLRYHPGTNFGFTSPFTTTHEMILGQDGKELGWSVAATFPVAQMESANVVYAGIPSSAPRRLNTWCFLVSMPKRSPSEVWSFQKVILSVYIHIHTYICVCIYIYIYIQTYTYTFIHVCLSYHMYIYKYIHSFPEISHNLHDSLS